MKKILLYFLFTFLFLSPFLSQAHVPDQGYIYLRVYETEGIEGRFEIEAKELNRIFNWGIKKENFKNVITSNYDELTTYLLNHSNFSSSQGQHNISFKGFNLFQNYVQVLFDLDNVDPLPDNMDVTYTIAFEESPNHRGFLLIEYNWRAGVLSNESNISLSFTPDNPTDTLDLTKMSIWTGFIAMIQQGIWHIWIGLDHIFFLIALILPAVVRRRKEVGLSPIKSWKPVDRFKPAFYYIIKIITFFTIAHTITLSLAALQIINIPGRVVESVIALSIGLAAFHNIKPLFKGEDWVIAFVFGLFHGFGFASVLGDIGLTDEFLVYSLLGFNVGVEIGQFVIIALIFPVLYFIRKSKFYPTILVGLSIFLIIASIYWLIDRAFDLNMDVESTIKFWLYDIAVKLGLK